MEVAGGLDSCGKRYLSNPYSNYISLSHTNDGSGRQEWYIPDFPIEEANHIESIQGYWT